MKPFKHDQVPRGENKNNLEVKEGGRIEAAKPEVP